MNDKHIYRFTSISEFHAMSSLPKPEHPLVSIVDYAKVKYHTNERNITWVQDFYTVGLKRDIQGKFRYGQQQYDFDEGLMSFVSPGQVVELTITNQRVNPSGILLLIHPDFLWQNPLAKHIKHYDFFGYAVNEALFLSEKEERIITDIMKNIEREYHSNIDRFSQTIIIAHLELLFSYCERFYQRQFITRKITNHRIIERLELLLNEYFKNTDLVNKGLPTVQFISTALNISPNYLSSLLKTLTNKTTKGHIQDKIIESAKEKLSTTALSVSEIAYNLGFEHPQSFSKFFKTKTLHSPIEFRKSYYS
jgi:AraC family transcriptional activator of pobA